MCPPDAPPDPDAREGPDDGPEIADGPDLTREERRWLGEIAGRVVARRMTTPVVLLLESTSPLHFVASQAMVGLEPLAALVGMGAAWRRLARILEKRGAVATLLAELEARERAADDEPAGDP